MPRATSLLLVLVLFVGNALSRPVPMEPAERTLFVFVHGINPRSAGAIVGDMGGKTGFCVEDAALLGRASQVWVTDLDGDRSDRSLFCSLQRTVFDRQFSLRAFTNPGATPVRLSHELGDRAWRSEDAGLQSLVVEAMRRYLEGRLARIAASGSGAPAPTSFESALRRIYPTGTVGSLKPIFDAAADSVPSRVVVLAHSMGGLTTREYLASDFFNGDLDKVVTFDTPHAGSWVAHYATDGVANPLQAGIEDGMKIGIGLALLGANQPWANLPGLVYTISGSASTRARIATNFAGYLANGFLGDEEGNRYMTPDNGALAKLNRMSAMPCEANGCRIPSFILHGVDGVLAPDDPGKFSGSGVPGWFLPLEGVDAAQAVTMTLGRSWPSSLSADDILGNAVVASSFAFGGWNYSQHGSLAVPLNSSRADGIPFLARPEVRERWREVDWKTEGVPELSALRSDYARWAGSFTGMSSEILALEALSVIATAQPWAYWQIAAVKIGVGLAIGTSTGYGMAANFAIYSHAQGASHNAPIWKNATRELRDTLERADGSKAILRFTEAEADLYEAPYAQIVSERTIGQGGDSLIVLGIGTGSAENPTREIQVEAGQFQNIRYQADGWENRWAVREERHVPVQDSATRVRLVTRRTLPVEILTKSQIRSLDFQIDDLRPDLMERMEIVMNYGMFRFLWERDHDGQGAPKGTFTFRRYQGGTQDSVAVMGNPIDAYGRWHVPLKAMVRSQYQVLIDGQNRIGVSLVNHVGKFSAQSQFITFQATPPVVAMEWPHPWSVVSDPGRNARFSANLLHYGGIRFDTAGAWWALSPDEAGIDSVVVRGIKGLVANESTQTLELPLSEAIGSGRDGKWELRLNIQDVQDVSKQKGTPAARRYPFWIDRTPPEFRIESESRGSEGARFLVRWSDAPEGLVDAVELVRTRVRKLSGEIVAELPPLEFATGGSRLMVWDGTADGRLLEDGQYVIEVIGKDGALPDPDAEQAVLSLRRELLAGLDSGASIWTPRRDSLWNALHARPSMNWSVAMDTFVLDRTAPKVASEAISSRVLGSLDRFQIALQVSDAGSALRQDSVALRLIFRDAAAGVQYGVDMLPGEVSGDPSNPTHRTFSEGSAGSGQLPDGTWSVAVVARDGVGNADTVELSGALRIDRTAPQFTFAAPNPSYVSSRGTKIQGSVGLEVGGAQDVTAQWRTPTGTSYPARLEALGSGQWKVSYPDAMRGSPGTWTLEVVARDAAGNSARRSTFVQVDLLPPHLRLPVQVDGPVVLKGIAMDPDLDDHPFEFYELSWRPAGSEEWRHDGLRIPLGRGVDSVPWRSRAEQGVDDVLGFWDPAGVAGAVQVRLRVDDGSGRTFEDVQETYVSSSVESGFRVRPDISRGTLAAGIASRVGFDILALGDARGFEAQSILVDARGEVLWSARRRSLKASRLEGHPESVVPGTIRVWRDQERWHMRSDATCRGLRVNLHTWSPGPVEFECPRGWTCRQDSLTDLRFALEGDTVEANRIVEWIIPAGSLDSVSWGLPNPGQLSIASNGMGGACPRAGGCADSLDGTGILPGPGEVLLGNSGASDCSRNASIRLDAGQSSLSDEWNGFRQNGNWAEGDSALLDIDAWDSATGRVENARLRIPLQGGVLRLGARALSGVLVDPDAPSLQRRASLEYTLEGRGAAVTARIQQGERVVRTLEHGGSWKEGRSGARPYGLAWDGADDLGRPVDPGTYSFVVEADGVAARADVVVGGSAWRSDSSLRFAIEPTEASWSADLGAWLLKPPPIVRVETGVEAERSGAAFQYGVRYEGRQNLLAFRTQRPSLMIRRKRDRVKFGLLWKVSTLQNGYDSDWSPKSGCSERSGPELVTNYYKGGIVEIGRGDTVTRELSEHVLPNPGETTYRMELSGHRIEYAAVPLKQYLSLPASMNDANWVSLTSTSLAHGSFYVDRLNITPTYGDDDVRDRTTNGYGRASLASKPNPPRKCARLSAESRVDSTLDHGSWVAKKCEDSDQDAVNPNRNLIWFGVRPIHYDLFLTGKYPRYRWNNGTAGAYCAPNDYTDFAFAFDMRVPDEFFDAEIGVDNLANRLLRFDAANAFLYGDDGFLVKDGYDNDGNGRIDDPGEAVGPMSPFERRSFQWRPRLIDPMRTIELGMVERSAAVPLPEGCETGACSAMESVASGLSRVGEPSFCREGGTQLCQRWRWWETVSAGEFLNVEAASNVLQDPLNFYEVDHATFPDSFFVWFANSPEQGDARFEAFARQGNRTWTFDSRHNRGPETAGRITLQRGDLLDKYGPFLSDPVEFTVSMRFDATDAASTSGDVVRAAWPLDSASWTAEKARLEQSCNGLDPADPSGCRRVFAAASGVRFGTNDGLEPRGSFGTWTSSAQEDFFGLRAMGVVANPDALPGDRFPSSEAVRWYSGAFHADGLGRSVFVDSTHFRGRPEGVPSGVDSIRAVPIAPGIDAQGPDASGLVHFLGSGTEAWTLDMDPRMRGASRLSMALDWPKGATVRAVPLMELYRSSVGPVGMSSPKLALFQESSAGILAANTDALAQVRLQDPMVAWRDGSDASGAFEMRGMGKDPTGFPYGLELRRTAKVGRDPEWIALQAGVPEGKVYQIAWQDDSGSLHILRDSTISSCSPGLFATGSCPLGLIDASRMGARGTLLLRVSDNGIWRYHAITFAQGSILPASGDASIGSLFGDARVLFPPGSLEGRSADLRAISVRLLSPAEAGVGEGAGVVVTGPVIEILPSQQFTGSGLPEVILRLPRAALVTAQGGLDPDRLRLHKIDPTTGMVVQLSAQRRIPFCDGLACQESDPWTEIEFHGRTTSFSRFALLPEGTPESQGWSISVTPSASRSVERFITAQGVDPSTLILSWDDDPFPSDPTDPSPPASAAVTWTGGRATITVPERPRSWLVARRSNGGLPKRLAVEWFADPFAFQSLASDTIVAGLDGAMEPIAYHSNHRGQLRLRVDSKDGSELGWLAGRLDSGTSSWALRSNPSWNSLPSSVQTTLIATDEAGDAIEVPGPLLIVDKNRPTVELHAALRRVRHGWILHVAPRATDDMGVSTRKILVETGRGDTLGSWSDLEERDLAIADSSLGESGTGQIHVRCVVSDFAGNRADASWSGVLDAPSRGCRLWLAPVGSGMQGWSVEDHGRHGLATRLSGTSSWRDEAITLLDTSSSIATDPVAEPDIREATVELLGIWDTNAVLIERAGGWSMRRAGRDLVVTDHGIAVRWSEVFPLRSRWMHLSLSWRPKELELFRDGIGLGRKSFAWSPWTDSRPWQIRGGRGDESRFALARVWDKAHDSSDVALWRAQALGIDSIQWIEAEHLDGTKRLWRPHCELPSRMALATGDSMRPVQFEVTGPLDVRLAGRWIADGVRLVSVELDGERIGDARLAPRTRWGALAPWTADSGVFQVHVPEQRHQVRLLLPPSLQLDAVALVSGEGDVARWSERELPVGPPQVEVQVRDESSADPHALKPRVRVRNLGVRPLSGYRLHLLVRDDAWRKPVFETWWPSSLSTSLVDDGHGLFTWTLQRELTIPGLGTDPEGDGVSIGIHDRTWRPWIRSDDPSWEPSWRNGEWVHSTGIPVFSLEGGLLSEWACRDGSDLGQPSQPKEFLDTVFSKAPVAVDGIRGRLMLPAEGSWNWGATVVGISALDGLPLEGSLRSGDARWPLSGWWQQIIIPNASRSNLTLFLDLGIARQVQIQKWHQ